MNENADRRKDTDILRLLCMLMALMLSVVCGLYLAALFGGEHVRNLILILGFLLHLMLVLTNLLQGRKSMSALALLASACCLGILVYFNM